MNNWSNENFEKVATDDELALKHFRKTPNFRLMPGVFALSSVEPIKLSHYFSSLARKIEFLSRD